MGVNNDILFEMRGEPTDERLAELARNIEFRGNFEYKNVKVERENVCGRTLFRPSGFSRHVNYVWPIAFTVPILWYLIRQEDVVTVWYGSDAYYEDEDRIDPDLVVTEDTLIKMMRKLADHVLNAGK